MAAIVGFLALNLIRGNQGRTWKAVRDDPVAASLVGLSPQSNKVLAFVISGFFAALAGAVMAQIFAYVGPALFGLTLSLSLLVGGDPWWPFLTCWRYGGSGLHRGLAQGDGGFRATIGLARPSGG